MVIRREIVLLTEIFCISYPFFNKCTHLLTSGISSLVHHFSISSGVYRKKNRLASSTQSNISLRVNRYNCTDFILLITLWFIMLAESQLGLIVWGYIPLLICLTCHTRFQFQVFVLKKHPFYHSFLFLIYLNNYCYLCRLIRFPVIT